MSIGQPNIARPDGRKVLPHTKLAAKAIAEFNRQKTKTEKERAEKYRMENRITRAEYLKRSEISKRLATVADAIMSRITSSDLPRHVKEEVLKDVASISLIFEEVAHAQSRFAAAKSKKAETETEDDEPAEG